MHLPLQHINVGHAGLEDVELALQIVQLDLEHADLVQPVAILRLALGQSGVLDLDLLVQQRQLIVAPDELWARAGVANG